MDSDNNNNMDDSIEKEEKEIEHMEYNIFPQIHTHPHTQTHTHTHSQMKRFPRHLLVGQLRLTTNGYN